MKIFKLLYILPFLLVLFACEEYEMKPEHSLINEPPEFSNIKAERISFSEVKATAKVNFAENTLSNDLEFGFIIGGNQSISETDEKFIGTLNESANTISAEFSLPSEGNFYVAPYIKSGSTYVIGNARLLEMERAFALSNLSTEIISFGKAKVTFNIDFAYEPAKDFVYGIVASTDNTLDESDEILFKSSISTSKKIEYTIERLDPDQNHFIIPYISDGEFIYVGDYSPITPDLDLTVFDASLVTSSRQSFEVAASFSIKSNSEDMEYGICYSTTNTQPTIEDMKILVGASTEGKEFNATVTTPDPSETYYVRSYVSGNGFVRYSETQELIVDNSLIFGSEDSKQQLYISSKFHKVQFIITKEELESMGITGPETITSIMFKVDDVTSSIGSTIDMHNVKIKMTEVSGDQSSMNGNFFDLSAIERNLSTGTSGNSINDRDNGTFNGYNLTRAFEYSFGGNILIELQYGISWGSAFVHTQNDESSKATWITKDYSNQANEATTGDILLERPITKFGFN